MSVLSGTVVNVTSSVMPIEFEEHPHSPSALIPESIRKSGWYPSASDSRHYYYSKICRFVDPGKPSDNFSHFNTGSFRISFDGE